MKRFPFIVFLFALLSTSLVWSQNEKKEAFLYIDKKPVYPEEFVRLYQKNLEVITDEEQKDLDNYLDLFISYKLRLAEAKQQGLDKENKYIEEITAYRNELTLRYLEDSQITDAILDDMYNRSKKEIHASHILINLPAYSYGKDTIKAYERINALRERAIAGENFNQLAEMHSEEEGAESSKGDLGFFSAMQMVMPFEDAAYTTPIGKVSSIIRTGYGYHIIKVHGERPAESKLRVAHIMIMKTKDSLADEKRIQEAYLALQNGNSFSDVAKEYSQDDATNKKGGELEPFGRKDIKLQVFTDTAYSLNEGTYSEPFKSDLGWHIVKLLERLPHPSKDEMKKKIKGFFETTGSSAYYDQKKQDRLLSILKYEQLSDAYAEDLLSVIERKYLTEKREPIYLSEKENKKMFKLGERIFYYNDFLTFAGDNKQYATDGMPVKQLLQNVFKKYRQTKVLEGYADKLYRENKEYAASVDEYNNGVLLFNLMQKQVWGKATKDTVAQRDYYNKHQAEFDLPEKWEVRIYNTKDVITATKLHEKLKSDVEEEEVRKEFGIKPLVELWSKGSNKLKSKDFKSGQTLAIFQDGTEYQVVKVQRYFPPEKRDFTSAQKDVVQTYSKAFEKQWIKKLRKKYKVKLKKKKWRKLKSDLI